MRVQVFVRTLLRPAWSSRLERTVPRRWWMLLVMLVWPVTLQAYSESAHQDMTFLAARLLNQCLIADGRAPLAALQVRHVARANVKMAARNVFARMLRWNYYASVPGAGRTLGGLLDTRFEGHYLRLTDEFAADEATDEDGASRLRKLGRLVFYLQRVSTPHRVVPVFSQRFWRLSWSDRFDEWPMDQSYLERTLPAECPAVLASAATPEMLLEAVAKDTLAAIRSPISGMPTTWEAFWKFPARAGEFGEYGPAGNRFGEEAEFDCGADERCILLAKDPLYREFANARHAAAVRATMQALLWLRPEPRVVVVPAPSPDALPGLPTGLPPGQAAEHPPGGGENAHQRDAHRVE